MFDKIAEYSEIGNYLEKLITKNIRKQEIKDIRQPLKIQFLFLNIILNSKSEKTYRNITFYIIIHIVFT